MCLNFTEAAALNLSSSAGSLPLGGRNESQSDEAPPSSWCVSWGEVRQHAECLSSPANKPPTTVPSLCRPKQQHLGKNNPRKVSGAALCPEFVTHFKPLQGPLSESQTFKVTWVLFNSQRGSFFKLQTMFQLWRMFWVSLIKDMQLTQEFCFVRKASGRNHQMFTLHLYVSVPILKAEQQEHDESVACLSARNMESV